MAQELFKFTLDTKALDKAARRLELLDPALPVDQSQRYYALRIVETVRNLYVREGLVFRGHLVQSVYATEVERRGKKGWQIGLRPVGEVHRYAWPIEVGSYNYETGPNLYRIQEWVAFKGWTEDYYTYTVRERKVVGHPTKGRPRQLAVGTKVRGIRRTPKPASYILWRHIFMFGTRPHPVWRPLLMAISPAYWASVVASVRRYLRANIPRRVE